MRGQLASDVMIVGVPRLDDVVDAVCALHLQDRRAHQAPAVILDDLHARKPES